MTIPFEIVETDCTVVKCDGGGEPLGHPAVYLNLGKEGEIICPYCSKCFLLVSHSSTTGSKTIDFALVS
jgi:uncharacterized Zn-finger protein